MNLILPALFALSALFTLAQADPAAQKAQLTGLSRTLGDKNFEKRERAFAQMKTLVTEKMEKDVALPIIRDLWEGAEDPEIKARLSSLGGDLFVQKKGSLFGFRFMTAGLVEVEGRKTLSLSVSDVINPSPALTAGLQAADLILGVNKELIGPGRSLDDILALFRRLPPEKTHQLLIRRGKEDLTLEIRPDPQDLTAADRQFFKNAYQKWLLAEKKEGKKPAP